MIYEIYFTKYDLDNDEIPEEWKIVKLKDVLTCELGGTPSRSKESYWNGTIPWINSGKINEFRIINAYEYITEKGLKNSSTKLLPKKTTVIAITGATLGQISLLEIDSCANQSVVGVLENKKVPYEFIYPLIKNKIDILINKQTGGAQQHINKGNVESLDILLPTENIMQEYQFITKPLYKQIEKKFI